MTDDLKKICLWFSVFLLATRAWLDPIFDTFKQGGGIGFGGALNAIVLLCGLFVLSVTKIKKDQQVYLLWVPIVVMSGVSVLYAPVFIDSLRAYLGWLSYFVMFILGFTLVRTDAEIRLVIKALYFSFFITVIYSGFQVLTGGLYYSEETFRLASSFSHPNIYAFYLVFVVSISFYFVVAKFNSKYVLWHKTAIAIGIVLLIMTQTRSAWIGMLLVFLVYLFFNNKRMLLLILVLLPVSAFLPVIGDRLADVFSGGGGEDEFIYYYERMNSYVWRKVVWGAAWQEIINRPFFGYGYNSFGYYFLDFFPYGADQGMDAHNSYVQIAFDSGVFAVIFYAMLLFGFLFLTLKFIDMDKKGVSVVVGLVLFYIVSGYSDNVTFYLNFNWYYWFFIGVLLRVNSGQRRKFSDVDSLGVSNDTLRIW